MGMETRPAWRFRAYWALAILLAVRVLAMVVVPLNDTTEARYAEVARKMLETGNWVTPLDTYTRPFWAKPPLSTWVSAASMGIFGVNEFAARLPALLLSLGAIALILPVARRHHGEGGALAATLVLAGSLLFYVAAGAVMTDAALMFCTTLSLVAFWRALHEPGRLWGYLFFVGLGLGLLAKGPLAVVLVGMPVGLWVILRREWAALWRRLPWILGTLLMLAIAVPWYAAAEVRTPGFLDYFIVGEHVRRFLDPGWKGDLYGFAHATPRGMIWPYALVALLPWSAAAIPWLLRHRRVAFAAGSEPAGWMSFLILWSVMTLVFFTLSGNIIWPYSLPMIPGFALLAAALWARVPGGGRALAPIALVSAFAALAAVAVFFIKPGVLGHTQKPIAAAWQAEHPDARSQFLLWGDHREFSAEFYSNGRARVTRDPAVVTALLADGIVDYLAVPAARMDELPAAVRDNFHEVARAPVGGQVWLLLREQAAPPATPKGEEKR